MFPSSVQLPANVLTSFFMAEQNSLVHVPHFLYPLCIDGSWAGGTTRLLWNVLLYTQVAWRVCLLIPAVNGRSFHFIRERHVFPLAPGDKQVSSPAVLGPWSTW